MICEYSKDNIEKAKVITDEMQCKLNDSLEKAEKFLTEQQSSTAWTGKAKDSFLAFMDLLVQYHKSVVTSQCMGDFSDALEQLLKEMDRFEDDPYYINLCSIQEG